MNKTLTRETSTAAGWKLTYSDSSVETVSTARPVMASTAMCGRIIDVGGAKVWFHDSLSDRSAGEQYVHNCQLVAGFRLRFDMISDEALDE